MSGRPSRSSSRASGRVTGRAQPEPPPKPPPRSTRSAATKKTTAATAAATKKAAAAAPKKKTTAPKKRSAPKKTAAAAAAAAPKKKTLAPKKTAAAAAPKKKRAAPKKRSVPKKRSAPKKRPTAPKPKKTISKRATAAATKKASDAAKAKAAKAAKAKAAKEAKAKAAKAKAAKLKKQKEAKAKAAAKARAEKAKAAKAAKEKKAAAAKAAKEAAAAAAAAEAAKPPPVPSGGVDVLLHKQKGDAPVLQLAELHRFAIDTSYTSVTGQVATREAAQPAAAPLADAVVAPVAPVRTTRYNTGYDLVLADAKHRIRCVLAPSLNEDVFHGRIRGGTAVTIDEWVFPRYNELVMGGGDPLVIVTKMSPHAEPMALHSRNQLSQLDWAFDSHAKVHPLVGHRAYYLSLNDDTVPYGGAWSKKHGNDDDSDEDEDEAAWMWDGNGKMDVEDIESTGDFLTIERSLDLTNGFHHESRPLAQGYNDAQAAAARKRKRVRPMQEPPPPIYGVVIKKSGLTHYATIDKAGKCPFHFHVIVQDQTRTNVMVTIWTSAAPIYYSRLSVGDPVAVCKYRFKKTLNSDDSATGYAVAEIAVNPVYPKRTGASTATQADTSGCPFLIRKLSGEAAEYLQLDTLPSPFITLSSRHICQLQAGTIFDFVGLVTYVGDPHVTVNDRWSERTSLRSFRWLKLRDQCSTAEIAVRLDDNVQHVSGLQGTLKVGNVALLTNLKVSASRASSGERSISCASTQHSQVYRDSQMPNLPQARKVKKWAASPRSQAVAAECDSLLLPFLDFRTFRGRFPRTNTLAFAQVIEACTQLRASEQRWFLVQGKLSGISPAVVRWRLDIPEESTDDLNDDTDDQGRGPTRKRRRGQGANRKTKSQSAAGAAKEAVAAEEEAAVAELVSSGKYMSTSRSFVNGSPSVHCPSLWLELFVRMHKRACVVELTGLNDAGTLSVVAASDASSRKRELAAGMLTDTTESSAASIGGPESLHPLINMAPWEGVKRAQRKSAGRAIVKANKDTDVGFKNASQAVLTAFKGSTLVAALRAEKAEDGALELQLLALFHPDEANSVASVDTQDAAVVQ